MTCCPACATAVDPLRSRFVAVVDGHVVAYCSPACASRAQPAAPVLRGAGVAPSTGVPARIATPVAGVPVAQAASGGGVAGLLGPPRPPTPAPGVPIELDSGPVIEIVYAPDPGALEAERAAFGQSASPAPAGDRPAVAAARSSRGSRPRGDAATASPVPKRAAATTGLDDEVAAARRRGAPLVVAIVVVAGASCALAYWYATRPAAPSVRTAPAARVAPIAAAPPAPPAIDPAAAVARARATLADALTATTPRVQRLAAAALVRTGDLAARDLLWGQLGQGAGSAGAAAPARDLSEIARLDAAYALARGGDGRGAAVLVAALASRRAEARDEAARRLALLDDPRAVPRLTDLLAVSQRRLGAAEHLAHLAEPHAIKVLDQLRRDPQASSDDRARATIALGFARQVDVAPALRDLLRDPHFNAFAAAALAELKDGAARSTLEHQLESPALRVRAARALRRLEPALDPRPLLPPLLDVLAGGRDTDQIQAAEAILLLAGPLAWSAHD
jgi:HEAT repeat protein